MTPQARPLIDAPLFTDRVADARELPRHLLVQLDNLVERLGDFAVGARGIGRDPDRKIPAAERVQYLQQLALIQRFGSGQVFCTHSMTLVAHNSGVISPSSCSIDYG